MLDISGVAHLFEGEAALIEDCRARLSAQGITVVIGAAGNPRAAWALARFSPVRTAPEPLSDKAFVKLFHDLPLAALGLDEKIVADMARAGLRRIGDIALRPRAPITARFGAVPIARLDALKGLERSSIAPRFRPPDFCAERQFASPIQTVEAIEVQLRKLADDLVVLLERQAKGARRIELSLYRVDGAMRRIRIGASRPLNEARAIVRLIAERLANPNEDAIDAGYGVDLMRLACLTAEPLAPSEAELERAHEAERARSLAELLDRLSARLGARAVTRRELIDAHLPEQAEAAAPATLASFALEFTRRSVRRVSSPQSPSNGRASFGRPMVGEDQGGGSHRLTRQGSSGAFNNLHDPRDPPPLPAPTRGGGCANVIDAAEMQARLRGESRHCEEPAGLARRNAASVGTRQSKGSLAMTDQAALRRGRCASSLARSRSRPWLKCPTVPLCVSAGGASCMMSRPSRDRSASPRPGGGMRGRRRATISALRIRKADASGSIARAYGVARQCGRNGLCTACLGKKSTAPGALDAQAP